MVINKIFPNPTVKQVIFQIRYPNLFFIENKIGDFQMEILKEFPKSSQIFKRQVLFADVGPEGLKRMPADFDTPTQKIWKFESEKKYNLDVTTNSLSIVSEFHKTYKLGDDSNNFRSIVKYVVDKFLNIIKLPTLNRIGLRYIDECPIQIKNNESFNEYYNSVFPINRFKIEDTEIMGFQSIVQRGDHKLLYSETLKQINNEYKLYIDSDAYAENIQSEKYLEILDKLHDSILEEYEKTIKEPVYNYMNNEV